MNKLGDKTLQQKLNISSLLQLDDPTNICSKQNIVINNTTDYLAGINTGDISTEYDPGF